MSTAIPLAELLQNAGVSSFEVSEKVLDKAITILREFEGRLRNITEGYGASQVQIPQKFSHTVVTQCIESLGSFLKGIDPEKYAKLGSLALKSVCIPYLKVLSVLYSNNQDSISVASALNAIGTLLSMLVKDGNVVLVREIFYVFEQMILDNLKLESHDQNDEEVERDEIHVYIVVSVLQYILETVTVHNLEKEECSLSSIFNAFLNLLQHCDAATCFLIASTPLPLLVSNPERSEKVWELIEAVYMSKMTVDCSSHNLIFTLLCCLHTVFIFYDSSSPFTSASPLLPSPTDELNNPVFDVRNKRTFWEIVQMGLVSSDALTRKKCMFLLRCVLSSMQSSSESIMSDGGVFWWERESVKDLQGVWNDLILVLETMEEKQVRYF